MPLFFIHGSLRGYDPDATQFTQEDPIGLGGGMNLYGFAGADPINHSDPFGLKIQCANSESCEFWNRLVAFVRNAMSSDDQTVAAAGRALNRVLRAVWDSKLTYRIDVREQNGVWNWWTGGAYTDTRVDLAGAGARTRMDPNYTSDKYRLPGVMVLWHEVGHAASMMGEDYDPDAGYKTENLMRLIMGCAPRTSERPPIPSCP